MQIYFRTFLLVVVLGLFGLPGLVHAQLTAFTYQGRLNDGAANANGIYDMEFLLFDAVTNGNQIGVTNSFTNIVVGSGLFAVTLDFGAAAFPASGNRWLEIRVRNVNDAPGFTTLSPRQIVTAQPFAIRAATANSADGLSSACVGCVIDSQIANLSSNKLIGPIGVGQGGTGATSAAAARTNLGLGPLATWAPAGPADTTRFLRGDNTWAVPPNLTAAVNVNTIPRYVGPTSFNNLQNSKIVDNGTRTAINAPLDNKTQLRIDNRQEALVGNGQSTMYVYRDRFSQFNGTSYDIDNSNTAITAYNFWGDNYSHAIGAWSYNDFTRTSAVFGAEKLLTYWGSLAYRSSAMVNYGVYGTSGYASGPGLSGNKEGIGGGFFGGFIGTVSRGGVIGQVTGGELFASYNVGHVLTSGFTADLVNLKNGGNGVPERAPAFNVTSPTLKVYDNGSAVIESKELFVKFSTAYAGMLNAAPDVTVSAVGSPAQIYIKEITPTGFIVAINGAGERVKFSWIAVGDRVDAASAAAAVPTEVLSAGFDNNLRDLMFDESNTKESGKPMWWNRGKFTTEPLPERAKARPERSPAQ